MPAFVLGNALAAGLMRQTRSAMLGVLSTIMCAPPEPRESSEARVVLHHALRNALVPLITLGALG